MLESYWGPTLVGLGIVGLALSSIMTAEGGRAETAGEEVGEEGLTVALNGKKRRMSKAIQDEALRREGNEPSTPAVETPSFRKDPTTLHDAGIVLGWARVAASRSICRNKICRRRRGRCSSMGRRGRIGK